MPVPEVTRLKPPDGPESGGTRVAIRGQHLAGATRVRFDGKAVQFQVLTPGKIVVLAPPGAGTVPVDVTTPDGMSTTQPYRFRSGRKAGNGKHVAWIVAGVVALLAVGGALYTTQRALHALAHTDGCPMAEFKELDKTTFPAGTVTLAPRTPAQVLKVVLGSGRDPQSTTVDFGSDVALTVPSATTSLPTSVGDFSRADGHPFPALMTNPGAGKPVPISAAATVANRTTVRLRVCFDANTPRRADAGTYLGTVAVDDDALKSPVITSISVSLKYPDPWGPLVLAMIAAFCATYLAALAQHGDGQFREWFGDHDHLSAVGFGVVAALAAYSTVYLRSEDWGSGGLLDAGKLFAAAFTAAAAGLTAHAASKNAAGTSTPS